MQLPKGAIRQKPAIAGNSSAIPDADDAPKKQVSFRQPKSETIAVNSKESLEESNNEDFMNLPVAEALVLPNEQESSQFYDDSERIVTLSQCDALPPFGEGPTPAGNEACDDNDSEAAIPPVFRRTSSLNLRPLLLSVQIYKRYPHEMLGISFRLSGSEDDQSLRIGMVNPDGRFAASSLRLGDRVLSLDNHRQCSDWTPQQASKYIRERSEGYLQLIVQCPGGDPNAAVAVVEKRKTSDVLGLGLVQDRQKRLRVKVIDSQGLYGGADRRILEEGDYVESINGTPCATVDSKEAAKMLRDAIGLVKVRVQRTNTARLSLGDMVSRFSTIRRPSTFAQIPSSEFLCATEVAQDVESGLVAMPTSENVAGNVNAAFRDVHPTFISVHIQKDNPDGDFGLSLVQPENDSTAIPIVSAIKPGSLLSRYPLQPGVQVWSIGLRRCIGWPISDIEKFLSAASGSITFVFEDVSLRGLPNEDSSHVLAFATKPSPRFVTGLAFMASSNGALKMGEVRPDGLFASSVLNQGDTVVSINAIATEFFSPHEAAALVQSSVDTVSILARTAKRTGIVVCELQADDDEYAANEKKRALLYTFFVFLFLAGVVIFLLRSSFS